MTRVAIAGLGAIGRTLARKLTDGLPGLSLACAAVGDRAKAQAWLDAEGIVCPLVEFEEFPVHADLAVEAEVIPSMPHAKDERDGMLVLLEGLGRLWTKGASRRQPICGCRGSPIMAVCRSASTSLQSCRGDGPCMLKTPGRAGVEDAL